MGKGEWKPGMVSRLLIKQRTFTCRCGKKKKGYFIPEGWFMAIIKSPNPRWGDYGQEFVAHSRECLLADIAGYLVGGKNETVAVQKQA